MKIDILNRIAIPPKYREPLAYGGIFAFCFGLFFYWNFPYDHLRDYLMRRIAQAERTGHPSLQGLRVEVGKLEPYWFTGVELSDVHIQKLNRLGNQSKLDLQFDELSLRLSVLSLIFGNKTISFDAEKDDGDIEGKVSMDDESVYIDAESSELDLKQVLPDGLWGLPLFGVLDGEIDLTVAKVAEETEGHIEIAIEDLALGDGKAELELMGSGFAIDHAKAGKLELSADVEKGVATIKRFTSKGRDMELAGRGTARLTIPFNSSSLDLLMRLKLTDNYRKKHSWVKGLFALAKFDPSKKGLLTPDEAFQFRLQGLLGNRLRTNPAAGESL